MKTEVSYGTISDDPDRFSTTPEDRYRPFKIRKKRKTKKEYWIAPEHQKFGRYMERGYRVDHKGRKMVELGTEVILDPRPTIMQPERKPIFLGLDQSAT